MTDDLSRRRLRAWLRLLRATRRTENHLRDYLRTRHGTTLPRFDVMAALDRADGPMKMTDLSRQLLVSNGNTTAVVERLARDGLVSREQAREDRRVVMVALTDEGRETFVRQAREHAAEIDRLWSGLDPETLDRLRDATRRIEGGFDDNDG